MRQIKKMTLGIGVLCIALLLVASATAVPVVQKRTRTDAAVSTLQKVEKQVTENKLLSKIKNMLQKIDVSKVKQVLQRLFPEKNVRNVLGDIDSDKLHQRLEFLLSNMNDEILDFNLFELFEWMVAGGIAGMILGMLIWPINPMLEIIALFSFPIIAGLLYIFGIVEGSPFEDR